MASSAWRALPAACVASVTWLQIGRCELDLADFASNAVVWTINFSDVAPLWLGTGECKPTCKVVQQRFSCRAESKQANLWGLAVVKATALLC